MTLTLLAPDGVAITAQQERQASAPLYGNGTLRTLGGRSGFRIGSDITTLIATTTQWTLKPFSAQIDAAAAFHQGMYGVASDADITGPLTAADATYDRKDIVYIQINDSSAGDGSGATNATVTYVAGTPAASPVAPTLPARSFLVGTITVPKVGGGSPTVALNTARFAAAGADLPVYSAAERDALIKHDGMSVKRMDLARRPRETWDGSAWNLDDYNETSANIATFGAGWTATAGHTPKVYREGSRVHSVGAVTISSGGSFAFIFDIPNGFKSANTGTLFVGTVVSRDGSVIQLMLSNNRLIADVGGNYRTGGMAVGDVLPVVASWSAT